MCPSCGKALTADAGAGYEQCPTCRFVWIAEPSLREYVRRCLERHGLADDLVALQEAPRPGTPTPCPACRAATLAPVRLRGLDASRCATCRGIWLPPGAAEWIAERVLVSSREWTRGRKLTDNLELEKILRNPSRYGNPG